MRELKFRVWSEEDREYRSDIKVSDLAIDIDGVPSTIYSPEGDRFDIEQYTGLKDKNGKKIYEGDIVEYETVYEGERVKGKGVVNFGNLDDTDGWTNGGYLCWRIGDWLSLDYGDRWIEVIGNIHENPELLEEE